jgi:hypothetical protein
MPNSRKFLWLFYAILHVVKRFTVGLSCTEYHWVNKGWRIEKLLEGSVRRRRKYWWSCGWQDRRQRQSWLCIADWKFTQTIRIPMCTVDLITWEPLEIFRSESDTISQGFQSDHNDITSQRGTCVSSGIAQCYIIPCTVASTGLVFMAKRVVFHLLHAPSWI